VLESSVGRVAPLILTTDVTEEPAVVVASPVNAGSRAEGSVDCAAIVVGLVQIATWPFEGVPTLLTLPPPGGVVQFALPLTLIPVANWFVGHWLGEFWSAVAVPALPLTFPTAVPENVGVTMVGLTLVTTSGPLPVEPTPWIVVGPVHCAN
jgi:hypothetical protein